MRTSRLDAGPEAVRLKEADRSQPDLGRALTDLAGPARSRPSGPVPCAVPESCGDPMPAFGRSLRLS